MKIIDDNLLNNISNQAQENSRLRMNYNFHESLDSKVQRLLNALEIGSEIPIHRHVDADETYIVLRGELEVRYYDNKKNIIETTILNPLKGHYGIHIPKGQWHGLEVKGANTVIFEVKEGPYKAISEEDIL